MRAVRVHAFGEPPRIDDVPAHGPPDAGQLGIDVVAAGVGSWDVGVAEGRLARFVDAEPPFVLGAELVGRVASVGPEVEGFAVGDRIIANPGIVGAWAERVVIRASACGPAPASLGDTDAAAIPVGAVTAIQALDLLALTSGASLLVLGAGGSVGRASVQLARARGLTVHVLVRAHEAMRLRSLGAEVTLEETDDWAARLDGPVDGVLDLIGGEPLERSTAVLRDDGIVVTVLAESRDAPVAARVRMDYLKMRSTTADLAAISAHVDARELALPVGVVLPVEDVERALTDLDSGSDRGKHVLAF